MIYTNSCQQYFSGSEWWKTAVAVISLGLIAILIGKSMRDGPTLKRHIENCKGTCKDCFPYVLGLCFCCCWWKRLKDECERCRSRSRHESQNQSGENADWQERNSDLEAYNVGHDIMDNAESQPESDQGPYI